MRILILGRGWIGTMLREYVEKAGWEASNPEILIGGDTLKKEEISLLKSAQVIVNTAAHTNIDWCEKNKIEAFRSNVLGALQIAEHARDLGKQYVFFSSACIFESQIASPDHGEALKLYHFTETDTPLPACFYSETKVMAEKLVREAYPQSLIVRPRLPLSEVPHPRNTIDKILSYPKLHSNQETVTVIEDMLPVLTSLIQKKATGVFHLVNAGTISPAEIADYFEHPHQTIDKKELDRMLQETGQAKRVTTYVTSTRIPPLPDIRSRMPSLAQAWLHNKERKI